MKKNRQCNLHFLGIGKILLTMRLLTLFLFCTVMHLSAAVYSQHVVFSFELKNATFEDLMNEIRRSSDYYFLYKDSEVAKIRKLNKNFKSVSIDEVLKECLSGTDLTYSIENNLIIIRKSDNLNVQDSVRKVRELLIRGKVKDIDGKPLPGVTVRIKSTHWGTSTDKDGKYKITIPELEHVILQFSFIGMETREIEYAGKDTIDVVLKESMASLEEVTIVSTGYQNIDKRKLTSAVTSIEAKDILLPGLNTIDQMLEGHVPGMIFMQNSGQVGATPRLRIRGTSTILGNQEPLWVVDGIVQQDPVNIDPSQLNDLDFVNLLGNAISGLNPEDIERIDVLKDASATAIYGVRAANGVIVITTKKGKPGPPTITYSLSGTFMRRPRYSDQSVNMMNSRERIAFSREMYEKRLEYPQVDSWVGYEGALKDWNEDKIEFDEFQRRVSELETMNTDWFDILLQDSYSHKHTLSMSGGSSTLRYYASVGFNDSRGTIKGEQNKNYSATLNLNASLNRFTVRFGMNGNVADKKYTPSETGVMDYAYKTSRAVPIYDNEGKLWYYSRLGDVSSIEGLPFNIINERNNSSQDINSHTINFLAGIDYRIIDPLKIGLTLSYGTSSTEQDTYFSENTYYAACLRGTRDEDNELPVGGELQEKDTDNETYLVRAQIDYHQYMDKEEYHGLTVALGGEVSSSRYTGREQIFRGYLRDRGFQMAEIDLDTYPRYKIWSQTPKARGIRSDQKTNIVSGYASLAYDYKDLYMFTANVRVDASNKFGTKSNDKLAPIWSFSGRWNVKEDILSSVNWINSLSLRGSFGYQGNMLDTESSELIIQKGGMIPTVNEFGSTIYRYPNPDLRWEKTSSFNVTLDFALLNNKIQGNVSYFYKRTKDAFLQKTISRINGRDNYVVNQGTLENKGIELSFNFVPVNTMGMGNSKGFRWNIDPQLGQVLNQLINNRKVKDNALLDIVTYRDYLNGTAQIVGRPLNTFYSYRFAGLDSKDGRPTFHNVNQTEEINGEIVNIEKKYDDMEKEDVFTTVMEHSGTRVPVIQGGIVNTFTYRNFTLSCNMTYSLGSKVRLLKLYSNIAYGYGTLAPQPTENVRKEYNRRWRRPGDELTTNIPGILSDQEFKATLQNSAWYSNKPYNFAKNIWQMYDDSDIRVVSGNYLKMQSLSLRYNVPAKFCEKLYLKSAYIGFYCTNLFTVCNKNLKGQDPATQSGTAPSINMSLCPTYSLNLNVSF
ncbi:SusC/RagA family TonB-linked outer membrane protein [uncultured Sanguibacteroides sp.]|uniref:SusC/RagA family TonB-linked outer membrane protein n=1 Tax=uncultured Sanguibacteroides sp. TaxID=1635151 RepID=UPI0025F60656|nr:SusC/RagA family TonB-linked outer membrane protein [uncultured Sanguibacteroides sp.]